MKKLLLLIAIAGIAMFAMLGRDRKDRESAAVVAPELVAPTTTITTSQLIKSLAETAKTENEKLPVMVDKFTRLDEVKTGPGEQISYFYTIPSHSSIDLDRSWIIKDMRPKVITEACADQELKKLLSMGANVVYIYNGKNGVEINRFQVVQSDCLHNR